MPQRTFATFFEQIDRSDPDACWLWPGKLDAYGYGCGMHGRAHRKSYIKHFGPIPPRVTVDHTCHNNDLSCPGGLTCEHRRCVNPAHLRLKTIKENILASHTTIASKNAAKTHCARRGHALTGDNVYLKSNGCRECRACGRESKQAYKQRQKALREAERGLRVRSGRPVRKAGSDRPVAPRPSRLG